MFERFTEPARNVVVAAQVQARELGHEKVGGEHVLLALAADRDCIGAKVLTGLGVDEAAVRAEVAVLGGSDADALKSLGIDLDEVRRRAEETFGPGALERPMGKRVGGLFRRGYARHTGGHLGFSQDAKSLLEGSLRQALALRHNYIGTEHMLLAVVADERSRAAGVLRRLGVSASHDEVKARVLAEITRAA